MQTRDARTVNPDENKPEEQSADLLDCSSVNIAYEWYMARCELHGKSDCVAKTDIDASLWFKKIKWHLDFQKKIASRENVSFLKIC